jgi:hypothetical protein
VKSNLENYVSLREITQTRKRPPRRTELKHGFFIPYVQLIFLRFSFQGLKHSSLREFKNRLIIYRKYGVYKIYEITYAKPSESFVHSWLKNEPNSEFLNDLTKSTAFLLALAFFLPCGNNVATTKKGNLVPSFLARSNPSTYQFPNN